MIDTAVPIPGEAVCPYCAHIVPIAPCPRLPGTWHASSYRCVTCGGQWYEVRDPITTTRYWEAVRAPAHPE